MSKKSRFQQVIIIFSFFPLSGREGGGGGGGGGGIVFFFFPSCGIRGTRVRGERKQSRNNEARRCSFPD